MSTSYRDRFIPSRKASKSFLVSSNESGEENFYGKLFEDTIVGSPQRLISFKEANSLPIASSFYRICDKINKNNEPTIKKRLTEIEPLKILDAPDFIDDYYLNLLDWGEQGQLAIALDSSLYLYDLNTGETSLLCSLEDDNTYISSVCWHGKGSCLTLGVSNGDIQIWDANRSIKVKTFQCHDDRVNCITSQGTTSGLLASAGKDKKIHLSDLRIKSPTFKSLIGHTQEICGLKFSPDGQEIASGANDNTLMLWDLNSSIPRWKLNEHSAAVKAIAWSPWQRGLLASGGGSADKTMKFWNSLTGSLVQSVEVGSQVCALQWSKNTKEIVSSHGFSENQLTVWKYPSMQKDIELKGHTNRVLHLALSPDGSTVASASADETLRFWKIFESSYGSKQKNQSGALSINFR